jgi:uncharacterized protein YcbK (DUF882 family)
MNYLREVSSFQSYLENDEPCSCCSAPTRRHFLRSVAAVAGLAILSPVLAASAERERTLTLYAPKTGEAMRATYWVPGEGYLEDALSEISHLMRDCRTDTVKRVDKELLDVIFVLKQELQLRQAVQVISGYRSPQTNAMLRRTTWGVAKHSMHICGQAADIRMPGKDYQMLYKAALQLGAGGVGRYRHSKFLHVDTGPVRTWG